MIVCIAEKPSVARDIAQILGATAQREGYLEGNGYQVTWTFGHLCELKYPEDYTPSWKRWSLGQLPMVPTRFGIRLKQDQGIDPDGEWAVRHAISQAIESFQLPYRLVANFRSNVADGNVAIEVQLTPGDVFPEECISREHKVMDQTAFTL